MNFVSCVLFLTLVLYHLCFVCLDKVSSVLFRSILFCSSLFLKFWFLKLFAEELLLFFFDDLLTHFCI